MSLTEEMSKAQKAKIEKIVKSLKGKTQEFKDRYGDEWEKVMYATATKKALQEGTTITSSSLKELEKVSSVDEVKKKAKDIINSSRTEARKKVALVQSIMSKKTKDQILSIMWNTLLSGEKLGTNSGYAKAMKESTLSEAKMIKAPSNRLITDVEYAMELFFQGKATVADLKKTSKGKPYATKKDIEKTLNNSFLLKSKAEESDISVEEMKKKLKELMSLAEEVDIEGDYLSYDDENEEDEQEFIDRHIVDVIDYPLDDDAARKSHEPKRNAGRRAADYEKGEDVDVYRAFNEHFNGKYSKVMKIIAEAKAATSSKSSNHVFKQGSIRLDDGKDMMLTKKDADALNKLMKELVLSNKNKMIDRLHKSAKDFNYIVDFANKAIEG